MLTRRLIAATALAALFVVPAGAKGPDQNLTPQDAQAWVGKPVYSNDGKELGKVDVLESSAENKATQLRADISATSGESPHQIILPSTRFTIQSDRIVLDMTANQAAALPNMKF